MELVWEEADQEFSTEIGPKQPEVLLGRNPDCQIRVSRSSVSRRHAVFTWTPNGVVVTDQGSTAGTYIDGKKIARARVEPGTIVNCGGVMVLLDAGAVQAAATVRAKVDHRSFGDASRDEHTFSGGTVKPAARLPEAEPAPAAAKAKSKLDDLDALFDGPMPSRRRSAETAEPPKRERGGFEAADFFSSSSTPAQIEDDEPPPPKAAPAPVAEAPKPAAKSSAKGHLACYLLYIDDDGNQAEVRVERDREPVLIGRREGATIKVHNPSVSGKHCTVGWDKDTDEVVVRDVGSSNGTFINSERIRRGVLNDNDVLGCGRFELRVSFIEHKAIAEVEYEQWADDWDEDELDPGLPNFHIIYRDGRGQLACMTMGEREKKIAVGSSGCEINIEGRDVEGEHCEFEWDDGVLIVKDLRSDSGTFVNNEQVEDETLRNGDVVVVGRVTLRIVRGTSDELEAPKPEARSEKGNVWARHLESRDDDLELLFIDGDVEDDGGKHELSIWGNGELRMESATTVGRNTTVGRVDRELRRLVYETLLKAGFPDAKTKEVRPNEKPAEIHMFQDRDEGKAVLSKKLTQRTIAYHELLEIFRATTAELSLKF